MINKFNSEEKENIKEKNNEVKYIKRDKNGDVESINSTGTPKNNIKKKKGKNKNYLVLMIISLVALIFLIWQTLLLGKSILGKPVDKNMMILSNIIDPVVKMFTKNIAPTPPIIEESQIKIGAVGDIYITNDMLNSYKKGNDYDFTKAFEQVKIYTEQFDYVIANLETPVAGNDLGLSTTKLYNAPQSLLNSLSKSKINILSLANERALDKGEDGLKNTIKNIEQEGLKYIGATNANDKNIEPVIVEKDGIKVGIVSYNNVNLKLTDNNKNMINTYSKEKAKADIDALKEKKVDAVVAYVHFGTLGVTRPTAEQREISQYLFELGADVVFGSHPHVIQPASDDVFSVGTEDKKRVYVTYSLGDFLGNSTYEDSEIGILAGITFKKEVQKDKKGNVLSTSVTFMPEDIVETWQDKKLKSGANFRRVLSIRKAVSDYDNKLDEDISSSDYLQLNEALKTATKILIRQ